MKSSRKTPTPLSVSQLAWRCDEKSMPFKSTKELEPLVAVVGQDRAIESLRLGTSIRSQGYNIWASGVVGTGRMSTIRKILAELEDSSAELYDFAYVHNFKTPELPVLLRFSAGEGRVFCTMLDDALGLLGRRIPALFEEEKFQENRKKIIEKFQLMEESLLREFDEKLRPQGFVLGQIEEEDGSAHPEIFPYIKEKPFTMEEVEELFQKGEIKAEDVAKLREQYSKYREELNDIGSRSLRIMGEFRKELSTHDQAAVGILIKTVFDDVRLSFPRDRVREHLAGIRKHILDHLEDYVKIQTARFAGALDEATEEAVASLTSLYQVNLILDNYDEKAAPAIIETSPTYASIFGTIEKRFDARGFTISDFSQIRAGSLLRANGGYLILNAMDVLADVTIWTALKRVMLYGRIEIQPIDSQYQLNSLKPDHINVSVKVILLGDPSIYHALWDADEDFHKMFKVHAEFDDDIDRTPEMITHYTHFFSRLAQNESLLHCNRSGAAALVEWAVAYTDSQDKITLQFSYVSDLMREASHFATVAGSRLIGRKHVEHALDQRRWRSNSVDIRMRSEIKKGTLLIDTTGSRVGQVNGLTVYQSGIVAYGKPSRITATVSAGDGGIINIEREVDMSGAIHSKGVLILSGLLRSLFSRSQPISFTASIAFEQSYGGIDGDSASVAEIIALLSAISNIAIRQDIAITGSINQKGDIQPVGGVNEKIIGFFEVCQDRGLTGTQGAILPVQNVRDLMLRSDVVAAVKAKKFQLWPVSTLDQAIELLMGMPAGKIRADGTMTPDTVYRKVQENLDVLHHASKSRSDD